MGLHNCSIVSSGILSHKFVRYVRYFIVFGCLRLQGYSGIRITRKKPGWNLEGKPRDSDSGKLKMYRRAIRNRKIVNKLFFSGVKILPVLNLFIPVQVLCFCLANLPNSFARKTKKFHQIPRFVYGFALKLLQMDNTNNYILFSLLGQTKKWRSEPTWPASFPAMPEPPQQAAPLAAKRRTAAEVGGRRTHPAPPRPPEPLRPSRKAWTSPAARGAGRPPPATS